MIIREKHCVCRAVCQSWLLGGKHNVTPTDKNSVRREPPRGAPDPPFFKGRKEATKFPEKKQPK